MIINVTKSSMPTLEEYIDEIKDLWESHLLTNMGVKHKTFEIKLKEYLKVSNISLYTNGHLALEAAIAAFDLKKEVITTPFSFVSSTHAIVRNGLKPVFCDINFEDYTLDANKLEALITENTQAILPVHVYGNVCNLEKIQEIANKYNLKVIYDAAHCFGVTYKDQGVGNFGDASMFSFHATKVFNTIEGGAVVYHDSKLSGKLNQVKNFGITGYETVESIGGNAKMTEFQAAMGLCNLRHIDTAITKRKIIFDRYKSNLTKTLGIKMPSEQIDVKSNYSYLPIVFDGYKANRDQVYEHLKKNDIFSRKYFYPLINSLECYRDQYDDNQTPVAKYIANRVLTLPLYEDLMIEDVDRICELILSI